MPPARLVGCVEVLRNAPCHRMLGAFRSSSTNPTGYTAMLAALFAVALCTGQTPPRQPHPLAPSIPQLSKEEEAKIEAIIDRFIKFDIGKLPAGQGKKAVEEFN